MSTIHSSWAPLGCRSALRCGTARFSTVRSIEHRRHGNARTARPTHSRRGLRRSALLTMGLSLLIDWCFRLPCRVSFEEIGDGRWLLVNDLVPAVR